MKRAGSYVPVVVTTTGTTGSDQTTTSGLAFTQEFAGGALVTPEAPIYVLEPGSWYEFTVNWNPQADAPGHVKWVATVYNSNNQPDTNYPSAPVSFKHPQDFDHRPDPSHPGHYKMHQGKVMLNDATLPDGDYIYLQGEVSGGQYDNKSDDVYSAALYYPDNAPTGYATVPPDSSASAAPPVVGSPPPLLGAPAPNAKQASHPEKAPLRPVYSFTEPNLQLEIPRNGVVKVALAQRSREAVVTARLFSHGRSAGSAPGVSIHRPIGSLIVHLRFRSPTRPGESIIVEARAGSQIQRIHVEVR